ncbi:uncharacterized protein LOC106074989 [Biomphalaria glabrata]|uniref:Uncharacterized protein LOC106074989 n=1 Tax=Biomphalaria glabrata TaxID=6526 RepID=A0A9W2YTT8_BIOGL|nr:uncharacterized protein LOC106074989 [Biomphalaria glabrata]XP_055866145.1 uncharacterized protein LOC106074989 [Biomphalaria glabrata]
MSSDENHNDNDNELNENSLNCDGNSSTTSEKAFCTSKTTKKRRKRKNCKSDSINSDIIDISEQPSKRRKLRSETSGRKLGSWLYSEKTKLLEAIKRYGQDDYFRISQYIGTKSVQEVESKIDALTIEKDAKEERIKESETVYSPIEIWSDLLQDIMLLEKDYSQTLSETLGLITRTEQFKDSKIPRLQWKNIYQYLTDLFADRVSVKTLTDIESLVVLDLMNSTRRTVEQLDITEQNKVLNIKFDLLKLKYYQKYLTLSKEIVGPFEAQAFNNDFREVERILKGEESPEDQQEKAESTFVKPKYISLNPLCLAADIVQLPTRGDC